MAETKKLVSAKPAAKAVAAKAADTKTAEVGTEAVVSAAKAESAAESEKEEKAVEAKRPGRKPGTKKAAAKKEAKQAPAKKEAIKETVHVQYADKSYSTEDLVRIAKDVWKYDLKQKVSDFKSVELYVKPEESIVYYVINGDVKGNFAI